MHHSQEPAGCFLVASGQAAKLLEATKEAFHFVTVAVQVAVDQPSDFAVLFAGNDDLRAQLLDGSHYRVRIIGFVGQHVARTLGGPQQDRRTTAIGPPAGPPPPARWAARA